MRLAVSQKAYENLAILTMEKGYSNFQTLEKVTRIRGMGDFIFNTFQHNSPEDWTDNRPEYLSDQDTVEPLYGTPIKIWFDHEEERRLPRLIKVSEETLLKAVKVGIYHHVTSPRLHIQKQTTPLMRMSLVLEVWGLNHLKPIKVVTNPNPLAKRYDPSDDYSPW